tara:strand:+ start:1263 stop:1505 length:243 start_codon:yes stop_codon:yes gene_type:complete
VKVETRFNVGDTVWYFDQYLRDRKITDIRVTKSISEESIVYSFGWNNPHMSNPNIVQKHESELYASKEDFLDEMNRRYGK